MGQQDIIKILNQKNRPLSSNEISKYLKKGLRSTQVLLKKLNETGFIKKVGEGKKLKYELVKDNEKKELKMEKEGNDIGR